MIQFLFGIQEQLKSLFASFATLVRIVFMSKKWVRLPRVHRQECVILGNGPSLNGSLEQYAANLPNYDLVCVNNFALSQLYGKIRPNSYIIAAREYWLPHVVESYQTIRLATFESLINNTSWDMNLFIPFDARTYKDFLDQFKQNPHLRLHFYNLTPVEGTVRLRNWLFKLGMGIPRPHNVLIPSIMIALKQGYHAIYLLGADHSWLPEISVNERNEVLVHQKHFYDEQSSRPDRMYMAGQRPRYLYEVLEKFCHTFKSYFVIKDYAQTIGANIYNATPNSFIDAFERKNLP